MRALGGQPPQQPVYVVRAVDEQLHEALARGHYVLVTAPPQTGRSLLLRHMADRLRREGFRCAEVYPRMLGGHEPTGESCIYGLIETVATQLALEDPLEFWKTTRDLPPIRRWIRFLGEVVQPGVDGPAVIFIDDLEDLAGLPIPRDDLLASLHPPSRKGGKRRVRHPLTFCLFANRRPEDLEGEAARLFLRADEIALEDLTRAEAQALLPSLTGLGADPGALLAAVLDWTSGHPAMSVALCASLAGQSVTAGDSEAIAVTRQVERVLLAEPSRVPALAAAERALQTGDPVRQVRLWRRLVSGELVDFDPDDAAQRALRAAGLAVVSGAKLRPRNRVFTAVFDHAWIEARQREQGLAIQVSAWLDADRDPALLLRGENLAAAARWAQGRADLGVDERDFLLAGLEHRLVEEARTQARREAHRQGRARQWISGLISAAVVLVGLLVATNLWHRAALGDAEEALAAALAARDEAVAAQARAARDVEVHRTTLRTLDEALNNLGMGGGLQVRLDALMAVARDTLVSGDDAARLRTEATALRRWAEQERERQSPAEARMKSLEASLEEARAQVKKAEEDRAREKAEAEAIAAAAAAVKSARITAAAAVAPEPPPPPAKPDPTAEILRQAQFYRRSLNRCRAVEVRQYVTARLTVKPDGAVQAAEVVSGHDGRAQAQCFEEVLRTFRFGAFQGDAATVTVNYSF